ncbi:LptF/LptG family permease [Aporhodopirellula aestuarii]|uniref:LptF/LptG family permease n=1 Tax=Aporhodopirellula aestuarii TaxID=2950107 RepID=A0ABT0U6K7_9BACT|nr:LptF/LptG family permease [Aporhodopirellula aestuarii]MCM2372577.1 LptF/LptG family permease [Aporhodopirellula aestuarii]
MLNTIQRRITKDILVMFLLSLFVITSLVMFIGVAREAMNQGLGVTSVFRLIPYAMPNALSLAVAGTALFSVCCVYGRMSADNELTVLQSIGVSPLPAMWPAIAITTLLSVTTVGLINIAFTWGFHGIEGVIMSSVQKIAYRVLEREHSFQHGPLSLMVQHVQGENLINPIIHIRRSDDDTITIHARSAVLKYDSAVCGLELSITDGSANMNDVASFRFPDTYKQLIPLCPDEKYDLLSAHPSHMRMSDLPKATLLQTIDIHRRESEIAVHTGFSLLTSRPREIGNGAAVRRKVRLTSSRQRLHRLAAEMHRRWASGFTCLAMSMIGIPLAIRMRASDTMSTFGIVFLPTVLVYYPIFALTLDLAKSGRIPPQGVWIANLLFITLSLVMIRRIIYRPASS